VDPASVYQIGFRLRRTTPVSLELRPASSWRALDTDQQQERKANGLSESMAGFTGLGHSSSDILDP